MNELLGILAEKLESYILPAMKDPDTFISDYDIELERLS